MKTLADLNANAHEYRTFGNEGSGTGPFTLRTSWAVGSQSRRWNRSGKTHLLRISTVLATHPDGGWKPNYYKVGQVYSAAAMCDSNGQHTGHVYPNVDTDAVDCQRCLKALQ
jgi:hypothetical protein